MHYVYYVLPIVYIYIVYIYIHIHTSTSNINHADLDRILYLCNVHHVMIGVISCTSYTYCMHLTHDSFISEYHNYAYHV